MNSKMMRINEYQINSMGDEVSNVILREFQDNIISFVGTKKGNVHGYSKDKTKELFKFNNLSNSEITCQEFIAKIPCSLSGDIRGNISVLDLANQKILNTYSRHTTEVTGFKCFEENKNNFISSSLDGSIKIWDLREKSEILSIKIQEPISCCSLSPDDEIVVGGTVDGKVKLWNMRENRLIKEFNEKNGKKITNIRFHPNEIKMISSGKDKLITYYDLENYTIEGKSNLNPKSITSLEYGEINNNVVIFAAGSNYMRIYNNIMNDFTSFKSLEINWKDCSDILLYKNEIFSASKLWNEIHLSKLTNSENMKNEKLKKKNSFSSPSNGKIDELKDLKELQKSHIKIIQIQDYRIRNLNPLINLWFEQKNLDSTIKLLRTIDDLNFITDIINMVLENRLLTQMNIDMACILFIKAEMLFGSTYKYFNKTAVSFFNQCLSRFSQDIISIKSAYKNPKCVLSTEQRIKKYDFFLSLIDNIIKKPSFEKIKNKFREKDLGKQLNILLNDYMFVIDRIKKSN